MGATLTIQQGPMRRRTRGSRFPLLALSLAALLAGPFARPAAAQSLGRVERERALNMLRQVREDVEKNYYDPTYRGVNLPERFADAEARVD